MPLILILLLSFILLYFVPVRFQVKALLSPTLQIIRLDLKLLYGLFSFTHQYSSDDQKSKNSGDSSHDHKPKNSGDSGHDQKLKGGGNSGRDQKTKASGDSGGNSAGDNVSADNDKVRDLPSLTEFWYRIQDYGLGIALLSLFIKNEAIHWVASFSATHSITKCIHLRWVTVMGLEDAATTAIATGASYALVGIALGHLQKFIDLSKCKRRRVSILPSYDQPKLETDFFCILELKIGHIIATGFLNYLRHFLRKEGVQSNERAPY